MIIPTYNRADYVGEAIQSALEQENVSIEVIVVDDGSADDTRAVVEAFGETVRYIRQDNAGASAARNTGIRAARADLVAFLDSDDLWLQGKLDQQCTELRRTGCVAHLTDVQIERSFANKVSLMILRDMLHLFDGDAPLVLDRPLALNIKYNFARTQSLMVKRSALLQAGLYNEEYRFFEDTDLMNRLALEGSWCVSPRTTVREIRRDEGIEGLGDENRRLPHIGQTALVAQMQTLLADDRLEPEERETIRTLLGRYAYTAGKFHSRVDNMPQARALLRTGWSEARSAQCLAASAVSFLPAMLRRKLGF